MSKKSKIKIVTLDEAKKRLKNIHNSLLKNGRTMGLRRIEEYKRKMKEKQAAAGGAPKDASDRKEEER